MLQILMKLILVTQTISDECNKNVAIVSFLLIGNMISLIQMIFFMTGRLSQSLNNEIDLRNISSLDQYRKGSMFEAVITNSN